MVLITHDLGLVAETADRMAVMYGGRMMETSPAKFMFSAPAHPYTAGLIESLPRIDRKVNRTLFNTRVCALDPRRTDRPAACSIHAVQCRPDGTRVSDQH